jgi:hypothetical protein
MALECEIGPSRAARRAASLTNRPSTGREGRVRTVLCKYRAKVALAHGSYTADISARARPWDRETPGFRIPRPLASTKLRAIHFVGARPKPDSKLCRVEARNSIEQPAQGPGKRCPCRQAGCKGR